jgi:hypothetical protein
MKYNPGDILHWTYPGDEMSTIIEQYIDWDGKHRYVSSTYNKNEDEYIRDSFSEEEIDRFIKEKIVICYSVK